MFRALLGVLPVALALTACGTRDRPATTTRDTTSTAPLIVVDHVAPALTATRASDTAGSSLVIARARAEIRTAMPEFHEWDDSTAAPGVIENEGPEPFLSAPLVGDFDLDGVPDVIFVGRNAEGENVVALLSHRGHPTVAQVTGDVNGAPPGTRRHRFLRLARNAALRLIAVDVIERNDRGEIQPPFLQYVYTAGHFAQWVEGE